MALEKEYALLPKRPNGEQFTPSSDKGKTRPIRSTNMRQPVSLAPLDAAS